MSPHRLLDRLRLQRNFARSLAVYRVSLARQAWNAPAPPAAPPGRHVPFLRPGPITRPPQPSGPYSQPARPAPAPPRQESVPRAPVRPPEARELLEPGLEIDIRFDEPVPLEATQPLTEAAQPVSSPAEAGVAGEETLQAQAGESDAAPQGEPEGGQKLEADPSTPAPPVLTERPPAVPGLQEAPETAALPHPGKAPELAVRPYREGPETADVLRSPSEGVRAARDIPRPPASPPAEAWVPPGEPQEFSVLTDVHEVQALDQGAEPGEQSGAGPEPRGLTPEAEAAPGSEALEPAGRSVASMLPPEENALGGAQPEVLSTAEVPSVLELAARLPAELEPPVRPLPPQPPGEVAEQAEGLALAPDSAGPVPAPGLRERLEGLEPPPPQGSGELDGIAPRPVQRAQAETPNPVPESGPVPESAASASQLGGSVPEAPLPELEAQRSERIEASGKAADLAAGAEPSPGPAVAPLPEVSPPAQPASPPQVPAPEPLPDVSRLLPAAPEVEFFRPRRSRPRPPEPEKAPVPPEEAKAGETPPKSEPAEAREAQAVPPTAVAQLFERLARTWPQPGDFQRLNPGRTNPPVPSPPRVPAPEPGGAPARGETAQRPPQAQPSNPLLETFQRLAKTWPKPGERVQPGLIPSAGARAETGRSFEGAEGLENAGLEAPQPGLPAGEVARFLALPGLDGSPAASAPPQARAWRLPDTPAPPPDPLPQPTPLADSTRRFLEPLLGFDPAEFPVYRDPTADRIASAYRADGVNVGRAVFLSAGHHSDEPRSVGLLAHELTHAARQQEPRFVPPVLRAVRPQASPDSEEGVAQGVEREVRRLAYAFQHDPAPLPAPEPPAVPVAPAFARAASSPPPAPRPRTAEEQAAFGNLPAPWEPLPAWLQPAVAEPAAPVPSPSALAVAGSSVAPVGDGVSVHTAPQGRPSAPELSPEGPLPQRPPQHQTPTPAPQPAPDLDALAQQVYRILKRRLAAERRRES